MVVVSQVDAMKEGVDVEVMEELKDFEGPQYTVHVGNWKHEEMVLS